jgi:hypothetical protein
MAARSLKLTARARWPIASGGTKRRSKCTPSTCASVVNTSSALRTGSIAAASSPGPTTTHGAVVRRCLMRAMSARSPQSATVRGFKVVGAIERIGSVRSCRHDRGNQPRALPLMPLAEPSTGWQSLSGALRALGGSAPLCRVGRSNEPAKAGGAAVIDRASGFLETEACTTRDLAARLVVTLAQTSLRKPSRAKQEPDDLTVRPLGGQGEEGSARPPVWRRPGRGLRRRSARDELHVRANRRSTSTADRAAGSIRRRY